MQNILSNTQFTYLEKMVLEKLLAYKNKHASNIKAQIIKAKVESRENSDVGFITNFIIPDDAPPLSTLSRNKVLEVYAQHPDIHAGAGFLVWFENGKLSSLEGYVFMGRWPINELKFRIVTRYDSLCSEWYRQMLTHLQRLNYI